MATCEVTSFRSAATLAAALAAWLAAALVSARTADAASAFSDDTEALSRYLSTFAWALDATFARSALILSNTSWAFFFAASIAAAAFASAAAISAAAFSARRSASAFAASAFFRASSAFA